MAIIYRVRKNWNDPKSQIGAYSVLDNAKKCADKNPGYNVYDNNGKRIYPAVINVIYRVRKTWADEASQKGAYKSLANAKAECDKYVGYHVYDYTGKSVYTSKKKAETIGDKILTACKVQSAWMKGYTYKWEANPTIEKSKKRGTCVTFVACVLQRLKVLKPGDYVWHDKKGKVIGTNSKMSVTYLSGTIKGNKSKFKAGDIVIVGNKNATKAGTSSHIFIVTGEWNSANNPMIWDNNTCKQGQKPRAYDGNRRVIARIRIKSL